MPPELRDRYSPPGWTLLGRFPDEDDGVGCWVLEHGGERALVELPPGFQSAAGSPRNYKYVLYSHDHYDHCELPFPTQAGFWGGDSLLTLGGEPLWVLHYPKHSITDRVIVFRGVAMVGDIELGTADTVTSPVEVGAAARRESMAAYASFQDRTGYRVHTVMSAHLNDFRTEVDWPALFRV